MHPEGPGRSQGAARGHPRIRRGDRGGGRDPRARDRGYHGRQEKFEALIDQFEATEDPIRHGMATVMISFLAGLFVGEEEYEGSGIISIWSVGFACRRATSGGSTVVATRGSGSLWGTDVGACPGRSRRASRAVYRGRPVAVSDGPRAAEPNSGVEPPQDHEESPLEETTAGPPCRPGAALPGITDILALLRIIGKKGSWRKSSL